MAENPEPYVAVPAELLKAAFEELGSLGSCVSGYDDTPEVPRQLVEVLVEFLEEDLGCDHAVNICTCGTAGVVDDLEKALNGLRTCQFCSGDGFYVSGTVGEGYKTCPDCKGTGVIGVHVQQQPPSEAKELLNQVTKADQSHAKAVRLFCEEPAQWDLDDWARFRALEDKAQNAIAAQPLLALLAVKSAFKRPEGSGNPYANAPD